MAAFNIPLEVGRGVTPIETPFQVQAGALGLKQMAQAQQIQRQVQAENALKIQEAQQNVTDQEALKKGYLDANGDLDQWPKLAAKYGASVNGVQKATDLVLNGKKTIATTDETTLKNQQAKWNAISSQAQALLALPDDQMVAQLPAEHAKAVQAGFAQPSDIPPSMTDPSQVRSWLKLQAAHGVTADQQIKNELASREDARKAALAPFQVTEAKAKATEATAKQVAQDLSAIKDQGALDAYRTAHPELTDIPGVYSPDAISAYQRKAVPVEKQPEFDIKSIEAAAAKSANPAGDAALIDGVIDPSDHAELNKRTKALVASARANGMPPAAIAGILKDGADQIGRTETAVASAAATKPIKIDIAAATAAARADAGGLTDDDYARAGEQYARTGVMPALGRDSVTRARIVKASNAWAKDQGFSPADIVQIQAAYSGDKKSLENFQKNRDQIVSFENTAKKNLDLFLTTAAKIPDTGVPWINAPLRTLDAKLIGSDNMAAVNAARQVANNVIAKVTSGGGLSGVLSDSARHEVQDYNPKDATFAQTKKVAEILKREMANRHQSMDATIQDIKGRIGNAGKSEEEARTIFRYTFRAGQAAIQSWRFSNVPR